MTHQAVRHKIGEKAQRSRVFDKLTLFLKAGPATPAGDGDLPLAPGYPQMLAAAGTFKIAVIFVPVYGSLQPKPPHGGAKQLHKPCVLCPALRQIAGQRAKKGQEK
jgi:hypothetical protein